MYCPYERYISGMKNYLCRFRDEELASVVEFSLQSIQLEHMMLNADA